MTEAMFKPSNRWQLPDFGKLVNYGRSIIEFNPTTTEFASIHNLGPEKASSFLEHLRACYICEKDDRTKRYNPSQFFLNALEYRLGESDLASLFYFNYVHYMEPTRWLVFELFDEVFYRGTREITKDLIMEQYISEKLRVTDDPKKHAKRINDAIRSLIGMSKQSLLQLSAFHSINLYRELGQFISLNMFIPSIRVFALTFKWAWQRNFGTQIISLGTSQIIKSIEFPFRTFRLSESESRAIVDELAHLKIIRVVKSADLDQIYFDSNCPEEEWYSL